MKWEKKDIPQELVRELSVKYGCDLLTASILARRGLTGGEEIRYFLEDDPRHLHNPFALPDMEDAVDRILAAKEEGEKVLVFGDRDVDGITGTVMLTEYLGGLGMDVSWRIPTGDDRYGLSVQAVEEFADAYGTLIITVDCGISCVEEIKRAGELSVDVIVTDHHEPPEELPEALAIVHPKLKDSPYPFRHLSGCGVAFKLISALRFARKSRLYGEPVCLLNTRPLNDAWIIEAFKTRNLLVTATLMETIIPGMVGIGDTRLPSFFEGQQILVWDGPFQKRVFERLFGRGVEVGMLDIAPEIHNEIPQTAGKSLLRIKELSRIARYAEKEFGELDVFFSLFSSFVQKREQLYGSENSLDLQFAALGTIQDIMPLKNENRIIIRSGLESLKANPRPGLSDLLFKLGLSGRPFTTKEISWNLGPVINAAGRMGCPEKAAALFFEKDPVKRDKLADELVLLNEERKKIEENIWNGAEGQARENLPAYDEKLAFVYGEHIFRGVTGLIAGRLARRFKVPGLAVSFGTTTATGSFRSAGGFDLRSLMKQCEDLFVSSGGHPYAQGFSMDRVHWDLFIDRLKEAVLTIEFQHAEDEEVVSVDAELPQEYLTPDIFKLVDRFEPYGEMNEPLTFLTRKLRIRDISFMGKLEVKHVKLTLDAGKYKWPAVYWQAADKVDRDFSLDDSVDLVYRLSRNWFNGTETPQIMVMDLRRSGGAGEALSPA
jgi:single-stranded-DNA-specific exonuclease